MQHDRDTESPAAIVEFDDVASARGDGLEQILSGLPVLPTMRALIPSLAEGLRVSAGLHAVEDLPRARDGGTKKVRSELIGSREAIRGAARAHLAHAQRRTQRRPRAEDRAQRVCNGYAYSARPAVDRADCR